MPPLVIQEVKTPDQALYLLLRYFPLRSVSQITHVRSPWPTAAKRSVVSKEDEQLELVTHSAQLNLGRKNDYSLKFQ